MSTAEEPEPISKPCFADSGVCILWKTASALQTNIGKLRNQLAKLLCMEAFNAVIIMYHLCVSDT